MRVCDLIIGGDFSVPGLDVPADGLWDDELAVIISNADVCAVNLEGPLTERLEERPKIGVHLKSAPAFAKYMKANGVSLVSLANNHIFDYDEPGVEDTERFCDGAGLLHAGIHRPEHTAESPVKYVIVKGKRIGFYCIAEHEFNYKDDFSTSTNLLEPARNVLEIQNAQKACDALIVFAHVGPEHWAYPSPRMVSMFRCFAEAGASAVINSHAHHVMGMECHHGVPIFYGLGNLCFAMEVKETSWHQGMLAKLAIAEDGTVKAETLFTSFDVAKARINWDKSPERKEEFLKISSALANPKTVDEQWGRFCSLQRKHILKEIVKGELAMLPGAFMRCIWGGNGTVSSGSYYAKGSRMLRAMFQCENHADVLARIFRDFEK